MEIESASSKSEVSAQSSNSYLFGTLLVIGALTAFILNPLIAIFVLFCGTLAFILRKAYPKDPEAAPDDFYRNYVRPVGRFCVWAPVALIAVVALLALGVYFAPFLLVGAMVCFVVKSVCQPVEESQGALRSEAEGEMLASVEVRQNE